ncbi:hypothetical protein GCM10009785_19780 [Brooklawnia cerclae]|uniref:Uncharacterized protein n=1 Tax=Brooklawnia cerclae TaxID=349934 RepID=A0ABX0SKR6_9ACTN|nr:hypothetical protein [Brooklawnia cerclae]NIH57281.1 hypothetical protein [Brooklawnia cerclae]
MRTVTTTYQPVYVRAEKTPYVAVKNGRQGLSVELKRSYWEEATRVMEDLDYQLGIPSLFDGGAA